MLQRKIGGQEPSNNSPCAQQSVAFTFGSKQCDHHCIGKPLHETPQRQQSREGSCAIVNKQRTRRATRTHVRARENKDKDDNQSFVMCTPVLEEDLPEKTESTGRDRRGRKLQARTCRCWQRMPTTQNSSGGGNLVGIDFAAIRHCRRRAVHDVELEHGR